MKKLLLCCFAVAMSSPAFAQQSYTIQTPGQMPTFVNPNGSGGYTIQTPGQMPTFVTPNGSGGYTSMTPGQMPTFINPTGVRPLGGLYGR